MDYAARQGRLAEFLQERRLDALLVGYSPNVRYLCGFTGSAGLLVATCGRPVFFTDGRYREQGQAEVKGARVLASKGPLLEAAAAWIKARGMNIVGIEAETMTVAMRNQLRRSLGSGIRVRATNGVVQQFRATKDEAEVAAIRQAAVLAAELLNVAVKAIRPGVLETDVAAELEYAARRAGADGMSFETIVASGPRSALPHGRASATPISARGFVVLDFGVILGGYCSDMTRTLHVGRPTAGDRGLYHAVLEAQLAAIAAVHAGASGAQVDSAARKTLKREKLDRYFTHSTGHGVGLEIHEPPRLARTQKQLLQPGMVVTIEPGAYVPGRGGVRIEDMVVVTASGCEVLTPAAKELIVL